MKQFIICMILALLVVCTCYCYGAESKKDTKKQQTNTSKEIRTRKQLFNQCVASGTSRSRCLYLYY